MSTRTLRSTRQSTSLQAQENAQNVKENGVKVNGGVSEVKPRSKAAAKAPKVFCSCRQADDGSPMIHCSECKEWYHFRCLQLDARDAEDIRLYVCPSCTEKTGLRTVLEYEGPEALEQHPNGHTDSTVSKDTPAEAEHRQQSDHEVPEESSDDGSEDDYVVEKRKGKRRADIHSSDSEADTNPKGTGRRVRRQSTASSNPKTKSSSHSPGPSGPNKRRKSTSAAHQPASKRKRSESAAAGTPAPGHGEDAARKYCSTKLQETFVEIFLNYPVLHEHGENEAEEEEFIFDKKREELADEEKSQLEDKARSFARELEECVFEMYAEPDPKSGKHAVGMKYKERFRMLTFNLNKPDRVVLHKRIASSHITPRELSTMSSTDLANEETKQSIRKAEREALAQSILKKTLLPTAKMTHKGMQDIEDVSGALSREREREHEREREQEEEDRIERERLERLRLQTQRAQAAQGSVPPESPISPTSGGWGAPPPVPMHALHQHDTGASPVRPSLNPLYIHSSSEVYASPVEQELNLADLINIDEEPGQELSISFAGPAVQSTSDGTPAPPETHGGEAMATGSQSPPPMSATGLSPFAARSAHLDFAPRPSFDLNAIWGSNGDTENTNEGGTQDVVMQEEPSQEQRAPSPVGEEDFGAGAADTDFDMFLQGGDDDAEKLPAEQENPVAVQVSFESSPNVWTGILSMPLDSTIAQEVSVHAQQMGGRTLGDDSLLWRTLFPAEHLRIDGRVPVDKSAHYLTQMRLNPHKELIAVAFSPAAETSADNFEALSKYLLAKGRHGLIFPWGNRPKEHHPGRELYIIPLPSSDPIPEFLELLDEPKLPKTRSTNYLIGVWVLNKGKLVAPPASALPPPPQSSLSPPIQPPSTSMPPPPLPPSILPPALAALPPSLLPFASQLPPNISPQALAAEVASLTPDQIQLMLQALSSNHAAPPPQLPTGPIPPGPPQPWMQAPPPFPPYPPAVSPPGHQHTQHARPPYPPPPDQFGHGPAQPPYPFQNGHHHDSPDREGGGRGWRGRGSNWNRDNGGQQRQRDSGWRGRARGRGNQSNSSRGRRQWDGPPQ